MRLAMVWFTLMLSRCRSAAVRPGRALSSLAKLCLRMRPSLSSSADAKVAERRASSCSAEKLQSSAHLVTVRVGVRVRVRVRARVRALARSFGGAQRLRSVDVQVHEQVLARDGVRSVQVEALEEEVQLVVQGRLRRGQRKDATRKVLE